MFCLILKSDELKIIHKYLKLYRFIYKPIHNFISLLRPPQPHFPPPSQFYFPSVSLLLLLHNFISLLFPSSSSTILFPFCFPPPPPPPPQFYFPSVSLLLLLHNFISLLFPSSSSSSSTILLFHHYLHHHH